MCLRVLKRVRMAAVLIRIIRLMIPFVSTRMVEGEVLASKVLPKLNPCPRTTRKRRSIDCSLSPFIFHHRRRDDPRGEDVEGSKLDILRGSD